MMRKDVRLIFVLAVLSFISVGCGSKQGDSDINVKPRATVSVGTAVRGDISNSLSVTGAFEVLRDEKVKSTITGKVEKVFILEGDAVKKGQLVASIVSQESDAAISGASQLLSQATSEAEKSQAEKALNLAVSTAAIAKITAPFSGSVVRRFVAEGELVNQGTDLVELVDPETEYFTANVPVNSISSIRTGQPVTVTIPGMRLNSISGVVEATNPSTDPNSQSVEVRISLRAIPALVTPGTFGNAQIKIGERKSVILVPKESVYHDDELNEYFVWRIQGDTLALLTRVSPGLSDSARVEVSSGLKAGDVVATVGGYGLPDSTAVTVSEK